MKRRQHQDAIDDRLTLLQRVGLIVGAVCVLMMPSVYRGGAEAAHAHPFLQVILVGPERALNHHHDHKTGVDEAEHDHDHQHCLDAGLEPPPTEVDVDTGDARRGDEPSIAPVSAEGGTTSVIAFGLGYLAQIAPPAEASVRYLHFLSTPSGRADWPVAPPPESYSVIL